MFTGTRVHGFTMSERPGNEWPGQGGGCGECVRVHRYTTSKQSGARGRVARKVGWMRRVLSVLSPVSEGYDERVDGYTGTL